MSKTQQYLDYIKETKSKNTYKEYKRGINAFSEWYGKDPDTILEERRQDVASGEFQSNILESNVIASIHFFHDAYADFKLFHIPYEPSDFHT